MSTIVTSQTTSDGKSTPIPSNTNSNSLRENKEFMELKRALEEMEEEELFKEIVLESPATTLCKSQDFSFFNNTSIFDSKPQKVDEKDKPLIFSLELKRVWEETSICSKDKEGDSHLSVEEAIALLSDISKLIDDDEDQEAIKKVEGAVVLCNRISTQMSSHTESKKSTPFLPSATHTMTSESYSAQSDSETKSSSEQTQLLEDALELMRKSNQSKDQIIRVPLRANELAQMNISKVILDIDKSLPSKKSP